MRRETYLLRVSAAELAHIRAAATAIGLAPATWCRMRVLAVMRDRQLRERAIFVELPRERDSRGRWCATDPRRERLRLSLSAAEREVLGRAVGGARQAFPAALRALLAV